MELNGYAGVVSLRISAAKGWKVYISKSGRCFVFDKLGALMVWGDDLETVTKQAKTYATFLKDLSDHTKNREDYNGFFVDNCRNLFYKPGQFEQIMKSYSHYACSAERFVQFAIPGGRELPALIRPAVLGLLAKGRKLVIEYQTQLAQLIDWAKSLPEIAQTNPDIFTPRLWLEFDQYLTRYFSPVPPPEPEPKTRAGVRIPQTLTPAQIKAIVQIADDSIALLPDGVNKNTYSTALNIILQGRQ